MLSAEIKTRAIRTENESSNVSQSWYLLLYAANNAENAQPGGWISLFRAIAPNLATAFLTRTRESTLCI